tara:strand:- start:72 stop:701 length:630 start_codon:yes stop_codon:yes gene_type:complete
MPTYRHKETGKRFLFVHIPRTAGRFFESNLKENRFELEQEKIWESVDGIELAHFHRELYEKHLDVNGIPHIAIIRNPIDRFFGASSFLKRMYGEDIQEAMEDPMMFSMMLANFPLSEAVNWYRPQVDFISDKTQVWRFEDGFKEEFGEWVSTVLGIPFTVEDVPYKKLSYDESKKLERSAKLVNNITALYRKDIELYYPELEAPFEEGS